MLVKIILVTIIEIRLKSFIYILSGSDVLTMLFQLTESLINQYNCTPPWLLYHNNQSEICGPHVSQDAAKKYKQHRYEAYDECENPCEKMFITTLFNSKSPGEQELQIRFARNIQITEDYIKVSLLEALANIGGYLGMILGNYIKRHGK